MKKVIATRKQNIEEALNSWKSITSKLNFLWRAYQADMPNENHIAFLDWLSGASRNSDRARESFLHRYASSHGPADILPDAKIRQKLITLPDTTKLIYAFGEFSGELHNYLNKGYSIHRKYPVFYPLAKFYNHEENSFSVNDEFVIYLSELNHVYAENYDQKTLLDQIETAMNGMAQAGVFDGMSEKKTIFDALEDCFRFDKETRRFSLRTNEPQTPSLIREALGTYSPKQQFTIDHIFNS